MDIPEILKWHQAEIKNIAECLYDIREKLTLSISKSDSMNHEIVTLKARADAQEKLSRKLIFYSVCAIVAIFSSEIMEHLPTLIKFMTLIKKI